MVKYFPSRTQSDKQQLLTTVVVAAACSLLVSVTVHWAWLTALVGTTTNECSDNIDNDGDFYFDANDTGCQDGRTQEWMHECNDMIDNDYDSMVDGGDPNCFVPASESEFNSIECSDAFDNDADHRIDAADTGCKDGRTQEWMHECNDKMDNDNDNTTDRADPNCFVPASESES